MRRLSVSPWANRYAMNERGKGHVMRYLPAISVVLVMLFGECGLGAVLEVPGQYASIQQAIDASSDGDTVRVAPGLYYETINFNGKNIVVTSTDPNDPRVVGYTIINGDGAGSVVTFENYETQATLTGFTITGGTGTLIRESGNSKYYYGAGIYCDWGSPTITHNVITNNVGPFREEEVRVDVGGGYYITTEYDRTYGGGIYYSGWGTISHNVIYNNSAYRGAGIYSNAGPVVKNNLIYNNTGYYGGGVYVYGGILQNNTFVGNDTSLNPEYGTGGNVYASFGYNPGQLVVSNNVICNAGSGGGIYYSGTPGDGLRFNNIWDNEPADYVAQDPRTYEAIYDGTASWTGQYGNISEDPVFASSWSQRYRLDAASPCISAGDPDLIPVVGETDIDGDPRIYAMRVDIGADEHVGYVKPLANAGVDQHILNPAPVTLDGTRSYFSDPSGMKTFQWTQTEGSPVELDDAMAAGPTFTPEAEGWYRFSLVVGDDQYGSLPDEVLVVVGNEVPVAHAGADALWEAPGGIQLDGSQSSDADPPDELTYTWTQIDGPPVTLEEPNSARPYFLSEQPAVYTFELVVSDPFSMSEADRVKIEASPFTAGGQVIEMDYQEYGRSYFTSQSGTGIASARDAESSSLDIQWLDTRTNEVRLLDAGRLDAMPQVDGDIVVWAAGSGYYFQPNRTNVHLEDLASEERITLARAGNDESCGYPMISGNKVVWLRHHDVDTDNEAAFDNCPYDIEGADISDLANPVYFTLAEDVGEGVPYPYDGYYTGFDGYVAISGDIVVWEGDGDIYGADISDLDNIRTFPICTAPERQSDPSISGHLVVWTDERDDIGDIYAADISDLDNIREFAAVAEPGWQLQPDVDGSVIVYCDGHNQVGDIRACCLSREYGIVPFDLPAYQYGRNPDIDGSALTWLQGSTLVRATLDFGYGLASGPIQNQTTGWHYDYFQHAINAAADGDVIVAEPGVYHERLRFRGKNLTVTSVDPQDPAIRAATVITGDGQLVLLADAETEDSLFTGFTVTGGTVGITCNTSQSTISYCDVFGNTGAGLKLWGRSKPTVTHCDFSGNGIGITMWAQTGTRHVLRNAGTIGNCLITGNRRYGVFGGQATFTNCTIADNLGYGLSCLEPVVDNSIIYFNNGGDENVTASRTLTATYSNIQGGWPGTGNIDADPLFVARGAWTEQGEWLPGDYHLKSAGWSWNRRAGDWAWDDQTSPCIDAADPSLPLGDEAPCETGPLSERASNSTRNMGAYGGTAEASLAPRP